MFPIPRNCLSILNMRLVPHLLFIFSFPIRLLGKISPDCAKSGTEFVTKSIILNLMTNPT